MDPLLGALQYLTNTNFNPFSANRRCLGPSNYEKQWFLGSDDPVWSKKPWSSNLEKFTVGIKFR